MEAANLKERLTELLDTQVEAVAYLCNQLETGESKPAYFLIGDVVDGQLLLSRQLNACVLNDAEQLAVEPHVSAVSERLVALCETCNSGNNLDIIMQIRLLIGSLALLKANFANLQIN